MTHTTIRTATGTLFERYLQLTRQSSWTEDADNLPKEIRSSHLTWMCVKALENLHVWPEDKLSRWLGYIQGVLAARGIIDVQQERDLSRPLFHAAYSNADVPIPSTLNNE
jgi:hypothetical protein